MFNSFGQAIATMLLAVSTFAFAGDFVEREMYAVNADGGILTITNIPCVTFPLPQQDVKWYEATTEDKTNNTLVKGCWLFAVDHPGIIIYWENGYKTAMLNPSVFSLVKPQLPDEVKQDTI
ncbi:MAG: hypothetical protein A3F67_05810 [Verrucomicrobia bacterium RIFCSPHIGHO2_12_FULL_41_10]|nr:MAG: hypothetical protein A3F67_05810 [Verrucomicrobia bacterium RIFCSPHIGHO2_12_FULL_41_10]